MRRTKNINPKAITVAACVGAFTVPTLVLAQETDAKTMTCAQFTALDPAGMLAVIEALHLASAEAAPPLDDAARQAAAITTVSACDGNPDMLAMDAMAVK